MPNLVFREQDADRWHAAHGSAANPYDQPDLYSYDVDEAHPLAAHAAMAVGLYVAVDEADLVRYIGQVRRPGNPGAVRERHRAHHKADDTWVGLWLLPLRDDCPAATVDRLEQELINAFDPISNDKHARHKRDD